MAWKIFNPNKGLFIAFDNQSKEYSEVGSMGLAAHWHKKKEAARVLGRKIPRNMRVGYSVFETRDAKKLWKEKTILNSASETKDRNPVERDLPTDDCEPDADLGLSIVTESAVPAQINQRRNSPYAI